MKKALFIHQGFELYGSDRIFIQVLEAWSSQPNNTVDIWLPETGPLFDKLTELGYHVEVKNLNTLRKDNLKKGNFSFFFSLRKHVKEYKKAFKNYQVIYVSSVVMLTQLIALRAYKGTKIVHVHELLFGLSKIIFSFFLWYSKARLISVSECVKRQISFVQKTKITTIYNGAKGISAPPAPIPSSEGKLRILLIGRISENKGQLFFLKSLATHGKSIMDQVQIRIVGEEFGENRYITDQLKTLISTNQWGNIELVPFASDPSPHYIWSDLVLVPTLYTESFGLVAIEGMSAGSLVLASKVGGLMEIINHKTNGFLFESGNSEDMLHGINYILNNLDRMDKIREAATNCFKGKFSQEVFLTNLANYFKGINT